MIKKSLVVLLLTLFSVGLIQAQVFPEHQVFVQGGGMLARGADNNETVNGFTVSLTYEKSQFMRNVSFGVELLYMSILDDIQLDSGPKVIEYWTIPISVFSKFYFGESALKPYAGFGLGLHFSNAMVDNFNQQQSDRGLAIHVPLGLRWFIGERLAVTADYRFYYLGSSYLGDNLAHTLNAGLGINF